ncbi:MAG: hypothetical protein AAF492_14000 [Verrucomicrobiota bacterium]
MMNKRYFSGAITALVISQSAIADEVKGLAARSTNYFETAVAVLLSEPETVDIEDRKYRVLIQDIETEEIKPKLKTGYASGFFIGRSNYYFFVTARHVARRLKPNSRLGFVNSRGESRQFVLARLVGKEELFEWHHHPETDISLAGVGSSQSGLPSVASFFPNFWIRRRRIASHEPT